MRMKFQMYGFFARNFDPNATDQLSNSCDYESCLGCTDANAFNYDSSALIDDGSCQSAASLMLNTWSVIAECSGEFIGSLAMKLQLLKVLMMVS